MHGFSLHGEFVFLQIPFGKLSLIFTLFWSDSVKAIHNGVFKEFEALPCFGDNLSADNKVIVLELAIFTLALLSRVLDFGESGHFFAKDGSLAVSGASWKKTW